MNKVNLVFILSNTYERFERTNKVLQNVGFNQTIHMPAIFTNHNRNCNGNNGHRLAFRNMWSLVKYSNLNTCIFEDDIEVTNKEFKASKLEFKNAENVIFLGEFWKRGRWWTNHAACFKPIAASILLKNTENCIRKKNIGIDSTIKKLCFKKILHCRKASKQFVILNGFKWFGDFHQNRSIKSYLHDSNNKRITS